MKKILTLLFFFFTLSVYSQTVIVSGYVRDSETGKGLEEANVYLAGVHRGSTTSKTGYYRLYLPAGDVNLNCSYVGYIKEQFHLTLTRDTILDINLHLDTLLKDVVVYAPRKDFGIQSSQISAVEVPVAQIKSIPALFGEVDVMKALQLLPGVQSVGDGNAGIYVRGGNYDQNMITLDGSTLYNADHLKGFVSCLNADVIQNVVLYKGGFPARFGSRLSSVIDIGIREGNNEYYHAGATLGVLSSKIHAEGPIEQGKSSFIIAARMSYLDMIVQPLIRKLADNSRTLASFADMDYYDINAKLTRKFSDRDKVSAVFYLGNDVAVTAPSDSRQEFFFELYNSNSLSNKSDRTENRWGNLVSSIYWTRTINDRMNSNVNLSYSRFQYRLKMSSVIENEIIDLGIDKRRSYYYENTRAAYNSGIADVSLAGDFNYVPDNLHHIRFGGKLSSQHFTPTVDVFKYVRTDKLGLSGEYFITESTIDTLLGKTNALRTMAVYCEDDFSAGDRLKFNTGLRYTLFNVKGKAWHSLEPRLSGRLLLSDALALKASFSLMQQGIHMLSSNNIVMPSDLWVPVTEKFAPMKSYQFAAGINYRTIKEVDYSLEGYYKTLNNTLEYMEGTSYMTAAGGWEEMVAAGRGWSYGMEFMAQKKTGRTTGWLSYTMSWSWRQFDRPGQLISAGDKFYANNDCRHNLSLTLSHRMGKSIELSGTFVLNSGKRGTLATDVMYGGIIDEFDPYCIPANMASSHLDDHVIYHPYGFSEIPDGAAYINHYSRFTTFSGRNGYELPLYHRLDIGVNYFIFHKTGKSTISLSVYNLYNRQNISNVYVGYHNDKTVLKGVCLLPVMPSINYSYQF
jgi:hypothetical protein